MGIPEDIAYFEQLLGELIIKYEQYFLGLEKREPLRLLTDTEAMARKYQAFQIVNTMMKFRYNAAIARLNSYKQYWGRITRLIEEGKYSRDRYKMALHHKEKPPGRPAVETEESPREKSAVSPEVEAVYNAYMEARRACNLPVQNIRQEMIAAAIEKQKPGIMRKFNCATVEFKVVIEEGTPKIKARPRV
jgi:hypothetical protein